MLEKLALMFVVTSDIKNGNRVRTKMAKVLKPHFVPLSAVSVAKKLPKWNIWLLESCQNQIILLQWKTVEWVMLPK